MDCHCFTGWACEQHPDSAWSHDECPGLRVRCHNPDCPWWKGSAPAALETRWADITEPSASARRTPVDY
jgi:hypothetical protein